MTESSPRALAPVSQNNQRTLFFPATTWETHQDLPQITKLFIELKKRDLVKNTDVYSVGYAKKEIEKIINAR